MNEQKIRLRVVTVTTDADGEKRETKTAHRGILRENENGVELRYEQVDEGVRAAIWLTQEEGCILMRRMGEMTGSLRFQPGERTPGVYSTIYGEIPVAVYTRETEVIRTDNGGEMKLDYDVFVGGERTGASRMTISWRL